MLCSIKSNLLTRSISLTEHSIMRERYLQSTQKRIMESFLPHISIKNWRYNVSTC